MRSVISTLLGLFLYSQVIYGDSRCRNEFWLQSTQSEYCPVGHTHEIPEETEEVVVFAYKLNCPLCVNTMRIIAEEGGAFTDVTETGVKGIMDHLEKQAKRCNTSRRGDYSYYSDYADIID